MNRAKTTILAGFGLVGVFLHMACGGGGGGGGLDPDADLPRLTLAQEDTAVDVALEDEEMIPRSGTRSHNPFVPGQCTWYAEKRARQQEWHLEFRQPWGRDAKNWWTLITNADRGAEPRVNAIMVLDEWIGNPHGHVAWVERVENSGRWLVKHGNFGYQRLVESLEGQPIHEATFVRNGSGMRVSTGSRVYRLLGFLYRPGSQAPPVPPPAPTDPSTLGAQISSQSSSPTIPLGGSARFTVRVRNTGSRVWRKDGSTPLHLGTWNPQDRIPDLVREDTVTHQPSGWSAPNRVTMRDQTVNPGAEATFDFWMSAPTDHQTGSFLQDFRLVMDNIDYGWFGPVIRWQVSITQGNVYAGEVVYKSPDPVIPRLGSARFEVRVKNTGTATWNRDQRVIVNLGTSNPRDRVPPFVREDTVGGSPSGWRAPNRVVMQEGTVAPGQTATFVFWMSALADKQLGLDRQHFELVAEDIDNGWFEPDLGIYWTVNVIP